MDASHREAKLVASSHQTPVHPTTGARVAQYERKDLLEALAAAAAELALEEAKEEMQSKAARPARASANFDTNFSGMDGRKRVSQENMLNFADVHHSNAEYFRKLEELKAAHVETMAKLEKMYQNKLNLKGIQPVIIRENEPSVSSRSGSEKAASPPVTLMPSPSERDAGQSSSEYVSSSDEEPPGPELEGPPKNRTMTLTYAKELISNMWKDFSVEDYIQSDDTDGGSVEKTRKKRKGWVPTITVPEPFQMTVREQKKGEQPRSRSHVEMLRALIRKQEEADAEGRKKFRATPVPSSILEPLYHDLVRRQEERRRAARAAAKDALLASQKPFKFMAREEQKQAARDQLRDFCKPQKKASRFKARPLPPSIYGPPARAQGPEEEFTGSPPAPPPGAPEHPPPLQPPRGPAARKPRCRRCRCRCRCKCKRRPRRPASDVENLPERCQHCLLGNSGSKLRSACDPLHLRAPPHPAATPERERVLTDSQAEEDNFKEARWPTTRRTSPLKSPSSKPAPFDFDPPRPTVSSRGREQAIRKSDKERRREYRQELEAREETLTKRPLLFEKVAQKNARLAAERHYSNTLKALGICDESVSKKGRRGNILEYFSQPEMKSLTEDEESLHEEKRDAIENGDDRDSLDPNGQESGKEEDGIGGESGEENSVGE
ncbi:protein FAM161A isoform X1 [Tenrec ecaudatus]|uniref:protein FAM161A isoform X1 n=1 Tax=Tenrec ecaudatus TaxID=94439 RepID=UPI003F5921DE